MKMKKLWRNRKALSPVIAAIILIAVTVAVSIAVAAWMGALTFTWMGYEEIGITTVAWSGDNLSVDITIDNTGTRDLTVSAIKINYVKIDTVSPATPFPFTTADTAKTLTITFAYVNGSSYDISVVTTGNYAFTDHFTGGVDYP